MTKMTSIIFMVENTDKIRSSIVFMKSMHKIKSHWKRCRVSRTLTSMNKFESIFKWQIMMTRQVEE